MKDKIQIFFLGLMLGLLIGLSFFILKLDDYFQQLSFYKNIGKNFISNVVEKKTETEAQKNDVKNYTYHPYKQINTAAVKNIKTDSLGSLQTNKTVIDSISNNDSLHLNSIESNNDENVVVKKDELLVTKNFPVIDLSSIKDEAKNKKDSLIQIVSGVKNDVPGNILNIEYWESPLNYKGYKMAKNKIILYGIAPDDELKLYRYDKNIYLKNNTGTYIMEYSNDFKQLEKVADESVLAILK